MAKKDAAPERTKAASKSGNAGRGTSKNAVRAVKLATGPEACRNCLQNAATSASPT